jgi:flagellar M-ring protein FliF
MQERLRSGWNTARDKWNQIEKKQRVRLVAVTIVVVAALALTVFFAFRPRYEMFAEMNDYNQRQQAISALNASGIRHQFRNGNQLYVDESRIEEVPFLMFSRDIMGASDVYTMGLAIENTGMGSTALMTRSLLIKNRESVLQGMIERFDGVRSAEVTLSLPNEASPWEMRNRGAAASVIVNTTRTLSAQEGRQIAGLVAASEYSLTIDDVFVTDQNFNILHSGDSDNALETRLSNQQDYERTFTSRFERQMRDQLMSSGLHNVMFATYFVFDWDEITEFMVRHYAPDGTEDGFLRRDNSIRDVMSSVGAGRPIGAEANDLMTYQTGGGGESSSRYDEWTREWIFDIIETQIFRNPGTFLSDGSGASITAIVTMSDYEEHMGSYLEENEITWGEYKVSFPVIEFLSDVDPVMLANLQTTVNHVANIYNFSSIPLTVYVQRNFVDIEPPAPLDIWLIVVLALLFLFIIILAYMAIRRATPEEIEEIEEPLTVEDMLATTRREEEIERQIEAEKLRAIEMGGDSEAKKAIEKFVDERPEAVAGLLRNWLNEEWE